MFSMVLRVLFHKQNVFSMVLKVFSFKNRCFGAPK